VCYQLKVPQRTKKAFARATGVQTIQMPGTQQPEYRRLVRRFPGQIRNKWGSFWNEITTSVKISNAHQNDALWECRIVANTSAFQAEDAGSIPFFPSSNHRLSPVRIVEPVFFYPYFNPFSFA